MTHVLIVGAGLAGCTIANELAANNIHVSLVDTAGQIGGKVRSYGCKATDVCNKCGLCLVSGLWEKVESPSANIDILLSTKLIDLIQEGESYTAVLKNAAGNIVIEEINHVVVAAGFDTADSGFVEYAASPAVINGSQLEKLLRERTGGGFLETAPESAAFIQCYGSRDRHEHSMYCSRVCCAYTTRAAKVIKHHYPACRVVFFYMEMQTVEPGEYYQSLLDAGIEFIKCRPVKVSTGETDGRAKVLITYDEPASGKRFCDSFDLLVLSDGIKPNHQAGQLAEKCGLAQDEAGFLRHVNAAMPGVLLAGCAAGPKKIEETYKESLSLAKSLVASLDKS